jgi:hypothetical protein
MQSAFCLIENIFSTKAKQDGTQLSNAMHMHLEHGLDQTERIGSVTALNELEHNLISTFISEIKCFILLP